MDIMVAMGQIQEPAIGLEAAGVVTRVGSEASKFKVGDRLMTWSLGCFSNYVRNDESMYQHIPTTMSYATAASLPMIYCTAYQSIVEEARLEKGEKILIHAAAGGVGQASIMIAQHIGAEIFATVGSQEKKDHIMKTFGIPADHIFNSRDLSFVQGIRRATNDGGVDVILNSLAGEALRESWSCLAWFGRFIELGKKDISTFIPRVQIPY
jgi:NADPH:quinone reductase-like Zn-dependent oxidoreductase